MKVKRARAYVYLFVLFILCQQTMADEDAKQTEQPSMELLEFLGSGETIDGQWLDPLYMVELDSRDLVDKQQADKQQADQRQEERKHE